MLMNVFKQSSRVLMNKVVVVTALGMLASSAVYAVGEPEKEEQVA